MVAVVKEKSFLLPKWLGWDQKGTVSDRFELTCCLASSETVLRRQLASIMERRYAKKEYTENLNLCLTEMHFIGGLQCKHVRKLKLRWWQLCVIQLSFERRMYGEIFCQPFIFHSLSNFLESSTLQRTGLRTRILADVDVCGTCLSIYAITQLRKLWSILVLRRAYILNTLVRLRVSMWTLWMDYHSFCFENNERHILSYSL